MINLMKMAAKWCIPSIEAHNDFFQVRRNKHLCMLAFVYREWWSGRNFSTDNEATMPRPNLERRAN